MSMNRKAAAPKEVQVERLVDLMNFFMAFDSYQEHLSGTETETTPLLVRGKTMAKRYMPAAMVAVKQHLGAVEERSDAKAFKVRFMQLERTKANPNTGPENLAGLVKTLIPWMKSRSQLFQGHFPVGQQPG